MIQKIVRDVFFLGQKSVPAQPRDIQVGQDLQDTLRANQNRCVGMAANMIGVRKRIIIVNMGIMNVVMYNPVIVRKDTPYETEIAPLLIMSELQEFDYAAATSIALVMLAIAFIILSVNAVAQSIVSRRVSGLA